MVLQLLYSLSHQWQPLYGTMITSGYTATKTPKNGVSMWA